jgi:hypothetical protein
MLTLLVRQERERLQAEVEAAQEACRREARSARQAASDAATLRGRAEQLVEAMGRVVRLVMRCCHGMRSAAASAAVRLQSASGYAPACMLLLGASLECTRHEAGTARGGHTCVQFSSPR